MLLIIIKIYLLNTGLYFLIRSLYNSICNNEYTVKAFVVTPHEMCEILVINV